MSSTRLHPSLPAPVVHTSHLSTTHSKSHVLAGVQDAYWSDEETEDAECPLCLEEMDVSDLNFKPCPCGYQVCRFCWHHIKENLNRRCPACRREYSDDAVQFKPIAKEDHKRMTQQKKQRERERKDLDALGRRHLVNVRVVQRNVVYVVGLGSRFAKEELISTLRSNEYFGQYGKISKILLVKRTPPGGRAPVVGLYITYHRREDAARAIAAVDGSPSPGGGQEVMRASYGTTKYCMAFLRSVSCTSNGCMDWHEWGDEKDCFTKEDLTTLKHTMKDTETRRSATVTKKHDEPEGSGSLPRTAGWAKGGALAGTTAANNGATPPSAHHARESPYRATRRGNRAPRVGTTGAETRTQTVPMRSSQVPERNRPTAQPAKTPSQASSSRPPTPAMPASLPQRPTTPASGSGKAAKAPKSPPAPVPPRSPTSSIAVESDMDSGSQDARSASPSVPPPQPQASIPSAPPGLLPPVPPGLSAPPGIPPHLASSPPVTRDPSSNRSYQMSNQARALLEDVRARRESIVPSSAASPFPDFDRTLQNLTGGDGAFGGFNFSLDPKLAGDDVDATLPDLDADPMPPFQTNYIDPYPILRAPQQQFSSFIAPPPGLAYPGTVGRPAFDPAIVAASVMERHSSAGSSYTGSFNPFGESNDGSRSPAGRLSASIDDDPGRRVSRFGFARERQGSGFSATSSPLQSADASLYSASEAAPSAGSSHAPWPFQRHHEFGLPPGIPLRTSTPGSLRSSPLVPQASAQPVYTSHQQSRFQPYDTGVNESLKDMIGIGRDRTTGSARTVPPDQQQGLYSFPSQPFQDPAIMSAARYGASSMSESGTQMSNSIGEELTSRVPLGPPPGLTIAHSAQIQVVPLGITTQPRLNLQINNHADMAHAAYASTPAPPVLLPVTVPAPAVVPASAPPSAHASSVASPVLSAADFPALSAEAPAVAPPVAVVTPVAVMDEGVQAKLERKAAKKAAAAERAVERERVAREKAVEKERAARVKAEEKERVARERAEEKDRAAREKAEERERLSKEKAERERVAREKAEKELVERERVLAEKAEKARVAKAHADEKQSLKAAELALASEALRRAKQAGDAKQTPSSSVKVGPAGNNDDIRPVTVKKGSRNDMQSTAQVPILSKMPKKNKPAAKPIKIPKDDDATDVQPSLPSAVTANSDQQQSPITRMPYLSEIAHSSQSGGHQDNVTHRLKEPMSPTDPMSLAELVEQIDVAHYGMNIMKHPFFDLSKINPAAKMPLEYGPLVHALSALSVGGGSFANTMPTGSIDNAVSSFQQLLETLTQTISDLLRLLPRTTWDDSSSFDGVLRDMLKGDDFLDEAGDDGNGRDDEVAALTLALERRARWMEVQLAKLEELHRDINTAAVRAVLAFNDRGWDASGFLPRVGCTLSRFDHLGVVEENGSTRPMGTDELEVRLAEAKEAVVFSETGLREAMEDMQALKPEYDD